MIPEEVHSNIDERQLVEQGEPPSAAPPASPADTIVERQEAPPPPAAPPTPPRGRLATSVQHMPLGGRWALGLALAFLSGVVILLTPYVGLGSIPYIWTALGFVVLFVLALAAGFVLSSWRAVLALVVAGAVGDFVGCWVFVVVSPAGTVEGLTGLAAALVAFLFLAVVTLPALIFFLLGGVGLGKHYGITLGQPHALSTGEASVSRWIAALAPVVGAGYPAASARFLPGGQFGVEFTVSMILYAVVLSATCLLAGWLLRSWWGLVVTPVVYVAVAAFASMLPWFGGGTDFSGWIGGFVLYIVLPAVVMSAIGTAIGMYQARLAGPLPPQAHA